MSSKSDLNSEKSFTRFLSRVREDLDTTIHEWLKSKLYWDPKFKDAAKHCMVGAGKSFRPALFLSWAFEFQGEHYSYSEKKLKTALALELIHTYSLIHDDLPAMDDDSWRRGRPTLHTLDGDAFAVLAGDAFLTEAFGVLADAFKDSPEKVGPAIKILSEASGVEGMVGGQWMDLTLLSGNQLKVETLKAVHRKKTGALLGAACELAVLDAHSISRYQELSSRARSWGVELGLLFQIRDDLLDVSGSGASIGKTAGKDERQGKDTFASLMSTQDLLDTVSEIENELATKFPEGVAEETVRELIDFVSRRSS